jgi:hypothetical protein
MDLGEIDEVQIVLILMYLLLLDMVLHTFQVLSISGCHSDLLAFIGGLMNKTD